MDDKIKAILTQKSASGQEAEEEKDSDFFSLFRGDGVHGAFLELRCRNGIVCAFPYDSISWINFAVTDGVLDIDFMGVAVRIEGRGLRRVFDHLKARKISWIKPADTDMQDSEHNDLFISEIWVFPPDYDEEAERDAEEQPE